MRRRTAQVLATLADGTLPPPKREVVLRRVRRSAKLSRALHHQSFAIERVRSLSDPAPASLRAWVEREERAVE